MEISRPLLITANVWAKEANINAEACLEMFHILSVAKKFVEINENIPHKTRRTASGPKFDHLNFRIFITTRETPQQERIVLLFSLGLELLEPMKF
jgi:hypothetical protein